MSGTSADEALLKFIDVLDELGLRYVIGGSYASAVYGFPRPTKDADLVVQIALDKTRPLAERLQDEFYASAQMMEDALRHRISFNVIHLSSSFKIDVFPALGNSFCMGQLDRACPKPLRGRAVLFCSAEDTVLAKLRWYRDADETSDRQWKDVLGVLEVQGSRLDAGYMRIWAAKLEVDDLLERAMQQAGAGL